MNSADALATGLALPFAGTSSFAAIQAAWRFYHNDAITLPVLAKPLQELACQSAQDACGAWVVVALDWSYLHYEHHPGKSDRMALRHQNNQGYKLLTALALSDTTGTPLAPVCLELQSACGLYSTRSGKLLRAESPLDGLTPVMQHVQALPWSKPVVFVIDREADSVGHYRRWAGQGWRFVVRADKERLVEHQGRERSLDYVAARVPLRRVGAATCKDQPCQWYLGQDSVVLSRPAREHRVKPAGKRRKARHRNVPGARLPLRLIVSELRDASGKVLARWLLLSNAPPEVPARTVAQWYLFRWQIENYHKLLKRGGLKLESWLQENAAALSKRLLIGAMAVALAWQLAADPSPNAANLRQLLVRLSGRQIKRGKGRPTFTIPALVAGLGVFLPALDLLEHHTPEELRTLAKATGLPRFNSPTPRTTPQGFA